MRLYKVLAIILLIIATALNGYSQTDTLKISSTLIGVGATGASLPQWIQSNRYGIFDSNQSAGLLLGVGAEAEGAFHSVGYKAGVEVFGNSYGGDAWLQQAYVNFSLYSFELKLGKEQFTTGMPNENLGSGSWLIGNNARPIPRVGFGLFEYTPVRFTHGWLEIKGALMHAFLNDDRGEKGTDGAQIHEKFAYLRLSKYFIQPYAGMGHSVLMAGVNPHGQQMTTNYWAVFFGKADPNGSGADQLNVAGGNSGIKELGFYIDLKEGKEVQFYFQRPLKDRATLPFFGRNKDFLTGLNYVNKNSKALVTGFNIELFKSSWQSGPGTPDPMVNGNFVHITRDISPNPEKWMEDNFGIVSPGITTDEVVEFLEDEVNYGHEFGGRANYLNNQDYYKGFTYHGRMIGPSLFHTVDQVKLYNPNFNDEWDFFVANNRVEALHLGVEGWVNKSVFYRLKYTHSRNYGTYAGLNQGRFQWESENPDSDYEYYFDGGLTQNYTLAEINYTSAKFSNFEFGLSIGYDFGELYNAFGTMLSMKFNFVNK